MTDSAVDKMISDDLRELAAMHGHPRVALANPFRALARTSTDLAGRFVDLARAVYVWRPVYAHRVARAVAGAAAVIAALLIAALVIADALRDPRSVVEPVWNVGGSLVLLSTIYLVAHAIGRRRFECAARARRVGVLSQGANDDAWALEAAARVDPWATSFTVAGLSMLLLAFGLVLGGGTRLGDVIAVVTGHHLATTAAFGTIVAVALGAVVHRARRGLPLPRWARLLEHGTTAAIGVALTCAALLLASHYTTGRSEDAQPSDVDRIMHAGELGVVLVASWLALRLRRRDLARTQRASS